MSYRPSNVLPTCVGMTQALARCDFDAVVAAMPFLTTCIWLAPHLSVLLASSGPDKHTILAFLIDEWPGCKGIDAHHVVQALSAGDVTSAQLLVDAFEFDFRRLAHDSLFSLITHVSFQPESLQWLMAQNTTLCPTHFLKRAFLAGNADAWLWAASTFTSHDFDYAELMLQSVIQRHDWRKHVTAILDILPQLKRRKVDFNTLICRAKFSADVLSKFQWIVSNAEYASTTDYFYSHSLRVSRWADAKFSTRFTQRVRVRVDPTLAFLAAVAVRRAMSVFGLVVSGSAWVRVASRRLFHVQTGHLHRVGTKPPAVQ